MGDFGIEVLDPLVVPYGLPGKHPLFLDSSCSWSDLGLDDMRELSSQEQSREGCDSVKKDPVPDEPSSPMKGVRAAFTHEELLERIEEELRKGAPSALVDTPGEIQPGGKAIPRPVPLSDLEYAQDLKSVVSKLTLPEDLCWDDNPNCGSTEFVLYDSPAVGFGSEHHKKTTTRAGLHFYEPVPPDMPTCPEPEASREVMPSGKTPPLGIAFNLSGDPRKVSRGVYTGMLDSKGKPSGMGVVAFQNKDMYIGEFSQGEMHGKGTFLFSGKDADVLAGDFEHNRYVV